ncbi:MAG: hypothetical protein NW224_26890 [Leptolyngbyaceae cyanobacterium bins.302]|nr:hypothetical protein [Leptolyngbyaceae cyanobacterium bins.302]
MTAQNLWKAVLAFYAVKIEDALSNGEDDQAEIIQRLCLDLARHLHRIKKKD